MGDASEPALADDGRGDDGIDTVACVVLRLLKELDDVKYQAAVADGAEGALVDASAAGDALAVVDNRLVLVVDADGFHFAALHAGTFLGDDGAIGTGLGTLAAFDALGLVDDAPVVDNGDGVAWTNVLAGMHQAATACGSHHHAGSGALVAGGFHHLDGVGVVLVAPHGHVDAFLYNGTLFVDTAVELGFGAWADDFGYLEIGIFEAALVGAADDLFQYLVFNPLYVGVEKFLFHNQS